MKLEKIKNIRYNQLKRQDYLDKGDRNILVSKMIYRLRGMTLDIKMQKTWKYDDLLGAVHKSRHPIRVYGGISQKMTKDDRGGEGSGKR